MSAAVGAHEQKVFASDCDRSHGTLAGVIVDVEDPRIEVTDERHPIVQGVADGSSRGAARQDGAERSLQPNSQLA